MEHKALFRKFCNQLLWHFPGQSFVLERLSCSSLQEMHLPTSLLSQRYQRAAVRTHLPCPSLLPFSHCMWKHIQDKVTFNHTEYLLSASKTVIYTIRNTKCYKVTFVQTKLPQGISPVQYESLLH